jgi:hypothetical protein
MVVSVGHTRSTRPHFRAGGFPAWPASTAFADGRLIELLKWVALLAMLAEHWMRYVAGELPPWLFAVGRLAFPLFVFALAIGLRGQPLPKLAAVMLRLFLWGVVAQAALQLVDAPRLQLNVLFTFTLGVAAAYALGSGRSSLAVAIALCAVGAVSLRAEFGPIGVAFVAGCVTLARAQDRPAAAWLVVAGLLAALAVPNGNHWALAAVPVAVLPAVLPVRLPRVRGIFYRLYALQFPVYAVAEGLLN